MGLCVKQIMRILSILFCLVLVFSLVGAAPARTGSVIVDSALPTVTTPDTSLLADAYEAQRTGIVLPPAEDDRKHNPMPGRIVAPGADKYGYYVELGAEEEAEETEMLSVMFSIPEQEAVMVDVPITVTQELVISNEENKTKNTTINLWNHVGTVEEELLRQYESFTVLDQGQEISEEPLFFLSLAAGEQRTLNLEYRYPAITQTVTCEEQSLVDLLPPGATITETDLPLETSLSTTCTVDLELARPEILFTPITVSLEDYPQLEGLTGFAGNQQITVENNQFLLEVNE